MLLLEAVRRVLPRGLGLSDGHWRSRHRTITALLWLHAAVVPAVAFVREGVGHAVFESALLVVAASLAQWGTFQRRWRALAATLGLLTSSALLVHLSGGLIEMHFHFFVMLAVITLYQDWTPFLFAIGYVMVHHGLLGTLVPTAVYDHPPAWDHPWTWAGVHGVFVLAASAAGVANWRLSEDARAAARKQHQFLGLLERAAVAANEAPGFETAAQVVLDEVCRMTGWPLGHAYVRPEGAAELVSTGVWHLADPVRLDAFRTATDATHFARGRGLPGRVFAEAQPVWVLDMTEDPESPRAAAVREAGLKSAFAFPALAGDDVVGVLEFFTDDAVEPDDALLEVMAHIGTQLGRVIERERAATRLGRSEAALRDANERLQELATTDPLTGLPNRALFADRLDHDLAVARREGHALALLFIDLDRFKAVNDSLGHGCGDELLVEVASRLSVAVRGSDTVARVGGDEFAVLLSSPTSPEEAAVVAERILHSLGASFMTAGVAVHPACSIGVACWPEDCGSKEELLQHADAAMYRAKSAGGNRFEMFQPAMTVAARERLGMEHELRRAVDRGELFLRYHPQVDLATGEIVAMEALLRWAHPMRGEIPPAEFVPLAEETGLIVPIGAWVLREACRQLVEWRQTVPGASQLRVAVNVSARQLAHPGFVALVGETLEATAVPAPQVELEITESMIVAEGGQAASAVRELRTLGVSVAVDDFGTGYSSLSYLRRFRVDRLKLDRSFIAGLGGGGEGTGTGDAAIVCAAIRMAHALGLEAVAEGVETQTQLAALREFGCEQGQGYLWTRPLLAREVPGWLCPAEVDSWASVGR